MINIILITLVILMIGWLIFRPKNNEDYWDGILDALLISDLFEILGKLISGISDIWDGDGGGFSGGGSSGDW